MLSHKREAHAYLITEVITYLIRMVGERAMMRLGRRSLHEQDSEPEPDIAAVRPLGREYLSHHRIPPTSSG